MNDRAKTLWEESTLSIWPRPGKFTAGEYDYNLEAYTESVIRECAKVYWNIDNGEQHSEYVDALKKHFGVEEQQKVAPKPKCSVCGTTENVRYMGGHQPYLCDSVDCIPF